MGLARIAATPAAKPAQRPGRVRRLSAASARPALRQSAQPMPRNIATATQRMRPSTSPQTATIQLRPRIAASGQSPSPMLTPTASGQAAANPPDSARAPSATHTGPGVMKRSRSAPA